MMMMMSSTNLQLICSVHLAHSKKLRYPHRACQRNVYRCYAFCVSRARSERARALRALVSASAAKRVNCNLFPHNIICSCRALPLVVVDSMCIAQLPYAGRVHFCLTAAEMKRFLSCQRRTYVCAQPVCSVKV